jgi:hypothetical protein
MVTLPNANYLLDGGKYNFILKVIREEWENNTWDATTATWLTSGNMLSTDTIQFIPITVEKVLPVGIPEAFSVKTAQENNIKPLVFYMKPVQPASIGGFNTNIDVAPLAVPATKLGWMNAHYWEVTNDGSIPGTNDVVTHVADVYPFDLADVFNDLDEKVSATRPISLDQNYKFEFKESDVDADGKNISVILKATPASTVAVPQSNAFAFPSWNAGYADHFYSLPLIGKDFVSNISTNKYVDGTAATAKDVKASYIYRNVSLKKDASLPAGYYQGDFEQEDVNVTFTTKYRSAFDITKLALITDDQLKTESGITGTTAADKDNILKWQLQHRWFMQIVDYENGYNMNNWAYTKDKVVKVTVDGGKTIKSIDPQELVKTTAPTGTAREFSFDRVVYNFANPMGTYVAKNVFLARAGLIGSADTSWGTLANLKDAYIPSLWDLIQADIVAYVPNTLKIDIKDYFTPALTTVGGKRHGIYLNPTDRDLLHPAITAPVQHKVTFQVVDCFGFTQDLEVQFFMLVPRIDMTPARQQ